METMKEPGRGIQTERIQIPEMMGYPWNPVAAFYKLDDQKLFIKKFSLQFMSRVTIAIFCLLILMFQAIPATIADENGALSDSEIVSQYSEAAPYSSGISAVSDGCSFIGNSNTHKFHVPSCSYVDKIKPEHLVCFSSANEATSAGYDPCKKCNPM